jgi:hypothetical protein
MNYYILLEEWSSIVRKFKDDENDGYEAEQLAFFILDYIRYTRFRQYNLFTQKRGEEFERMFEKAQEAEFSTDMLRRYIEDDERWQTTLEVADQ